MEAQPNNPPEMPWQKKWVEEPIQAIGKAAQDVVGAIKSGKMPWEKSWKEATPVEAPKAPTSPSGHDFDTVFSRLINAESRGRHTDASGKLTTSNKGAEGLTQVMPKTGTLPGFGVTPIQDKTEAEYKRFGRDYLQAMVREFNGDYEKALAAYNAGVGNVQKAILKAGEKGNWKDFLPKPQETLPYINKILGSNSISREGRSEAYDKNGQPNRQVFDSKPTISYEEYQKTPYAKEENRIAWAKKMQAEYKKTGGKFQGQEYSNYWFYAKHKYPEEFQKVSDAIVMADRLSGNTQRSDEFLKHFNPNITNFTSNSSTAGFVFNEKGDRVFLNVGSDAGTAVHETEHLRQQKDFANMGLKAPHAQVGMIGNSHTPIAKLMRFTYENKDDKSVEEVFRSSNAHNGSNEWLANLQTFIKTGIPEGKSWSDTAFYKKLVSKFGEKDAQTMLIDALSVLNRAEYTIDRVNK